MEWIIWILVIVAVIAIVVWMLRRNSGPGSGTNTPEQRHPGNQPGSGANEPIVEAGPPVSNTPAAGAAGAGATGSVTAAGADRDTHAPGPADERWQDGTAEGRDDHTAPDHGARHTTAADGRVNDAASGSDAAPHNNAASDGVEPPPGQSEEHNALGRHNVGEGVQGEDDDSLGAHNIGEDQPGDPDYDSLGSHNTGGPHSEKGRHSLGSHNLGEGDNADDVVDDDHADRNKGTS